jgi:hypothetical protein
MEERPAAGHYETIVTHHDFDGIVSAALCSWALKVDRVMFAGPLAINRAQITITEKDIVCDLPYPLQCGLWFDHHEGNREELTYRKLDMASIPGRFDLKPSCSRVVYEFFSEGLEIPAYFLSSVEEADRIDSFAYSSVDDWRRETPGKIIEYTLKVRYPSAEEQNGHMRNLVQQLRDRSVEEVASLPFVRKRFQQYQEEEQQMLRSIREASYFLEQDRGKEVVLIDLTKYQRRPHLSKNLAFLIYPEALAVLEIYQPTEHGVKSNHVGLSMSLSIKGNQENRPRNIGEIMRSLNIGDGHPGAAAGTVRCKSKQEMLRKKEDVLNQIFRLWSQQSHSLPAGLRDLKEEPVCDKK